MDLVFLRFCSQRCYILYNKRCLKKPEIKLNQGFFLRIHYCIPKYNFICILYNIFIKPEEKLCLKVTVRNNFFFSS